MQKKIIALAVAAVASGAAFAQTNVTISGNLNYQYENISGSAPTMNSTPGLLTANKTPAEGRGRLNENGSSLRFAVVEDLGNGLKAGVSIGSGIQATDTNNFTAGRPTGIDGGSSSRGGLGGQDSWIYLGGKFGMIEMGRLSTHYTAGDKVDSFSTNAALAGSTRGIFNGVGGVGYGTGGGGRFGNSLRYTTPTISGLNGQFTYARPNSSAANDGVIANGAAGAFPATVIRKESLWSVKGEFNNGPMTAFGSYVAQNDMPGTIVNFQNNANTALTAATNVAQYAREVRGFRAGLAYTFTNGLKVGAIYDNTKTLWRDDSNNLTSADDDLVIKRTAWAIPVSWAFGPHTVGATYAKAGDLQIGGTIATPMVAAATAVTNASGARFWTAGYQYAFSKRTNIGLTFARIDNDSRGSYDFFSNAAMGMTATSTAVNTRGSDPTSVSLGMKHSF